MARPLPTLAQRLREHRELFELALQLGVTPAEARAQRDLAAAKARWEATRDRLNAKRNARPHKPRPLI